MRKPEYLNDKEVDSIQKFLQDDVMREAVRKVLLSGIYQDGKLEAGEPADPLRNFILGAFSTQQAQLLTSEEKGRKLDGIINGISLVESGFRELERMKEEEQKPVKSPINKAR